MRSLWAVWPSVRARIRRSRLRLLLLDFDGTLAKIARTPQEAVLRRGTQELLGRLSRSPKYRLAVISGRSLKDLRTFLPLRNIVCAGNHGLELSGRGYRLPGKIAEAKKLNPLLWLLARKLKKVLSDVPGAVVEDKGYTLSIHFRNVPKKCLSAFSRAVAGIQREHAHWPFVWKEGKRVREVRPSVSWDKGDMASYLSKRFPSALPLVLGDDVTDEDMFRALARRGVTIRVGRSRRSRAKYYVESTREVGRFLEELCRL